MIRKPTQFIPDIAWNFASFGLMIFLGCSGISIARTKQYQLEIAEYKLAVGSALNQVQEVSDTLEKSAGTLPITSNERKEIEATTEKIDQTLGEIEADIDLEIDNLMLKQQEK